MWQQCGFSALKGGVYTVGWVERVLKVGDEVEFKGRPGEWWKVEWTGARLERPPEKGWNVGGVRENPHRE